MFMKLLRPLNGKQADRQEVLSPTKTTALSNGWKWDKKIEQSLPAAMFRETPSYYSQ